MAVRVWRVCYLIVGYVALGVLFNTVHAMVVTVVCGAEAFVE